MSEGTGQKENRRQARVQAVHVPFRGAPDIVNNVINCSKPIVSEVKTRPRRW